MFTPSHQNVASPWWIFLWAMVCFIVYGSLFPFNFQPAPRSISHFYDEWHLFRDTSDAFDNFLLFVPLGLAIHACCQTRRARWLLTGVAVLLLAVGIQLVQLYLPSRTASLSDAFWNSTGLACGFLVASRLRKMLAQRFLRSVRRQDYFAMQLVLLWFFYESFPFLPSLDISLLRAHVKTAIDAPPYEAMRFLQHMLAATLAGVAMLRLNWLQSRVAQLLLLGGLGMVLEIFVTYGSLRRETLLGMTSGFLIAYVLETRQAQKTPIVMGVLALSAYLITLLIPFRDQVRDFGFTWTPFSNILWHGVGKDISPMAFEVLAIGVLLWVIGSRPGLTRPQVWRLAAGVLLGIAALEWLRFAVLGFHGDTSPWLMTLVLCPFALLPSAPVSSGTTAVSPVSVVRTCRAPLLWLLACSLGLTLLFWWVLQLPGIPYNLKKIVGSNSLWGATVFAWVLLWLGSGPWLVVQRFVRRTRRRPYSSVIELPFLLLLVALTSYGLLNLVVPDLMLNKIIGAPDLYNRIVLDNYYGAGWREAVAVWPVDLVNSLERVLRFCALYLLLLLPMISATLVVITFNHDSDFSSLRAQRRNPQGSGLVLYLALVTLFFSLGWLAKHMVFDWAITDNLTELVAVTGLPWLAGVLLLLTSNATHLASHPGRPLALSIAILLTVAALPLSWYFLNQGLEPVVINSGRVFSAIQFLLGENRTDLLTEWALFTRWSLFYLCSTLVLALGLAFARRLWPLPTLARVPLSIVN